MIQIIMFKYVSKYSMLHIKLLLGWQCVKFIMIHGMNINIVIMEIIRSIRWFFSCFHAKDLIIIVVEIIRNNMSHIINIGNSYQFSYEEPTDEKIIKLIDIKSDILKIIFIFLVFWFDFFIFDVDFIL